MASELLWNLGLGLFCLLAVLSIGQLGKLFMVIGAKLSNAMQQPLPVGKAPWPYYKHGMPPAAEAKAAAGVPFAPTGAWASPVFSDCSDTSCCSPAPQPKARSPPNFFSKMKKMQQQSKDQTRGEKHEAMDRLRTEQGTRLEEQEEALAVRYKQRAVKLTGMLLDDMFDRDPDYGSTLVNSIPAGLKHQCFMAELHRRLGAQGEHAMAHAASNPMAIKRASDATFEAIIGQARKGLTPRRARKVTDVLALKTEERPPTNYPHPLRFREPDAKERTKWWWYYQLKNAEEGKYASLLEAAFTSPDDFVFPTEPVPGAMCSC